KRLEDLDWLAVVSVRHQRAVAAIAESRDTLPARLGTVFLSEASLEADIRKRKAALDADLRRIAGTHEWGIKVFVSPQPAVLPALFICFAEREIGVKQATELLQNASQTA